MPQTLYIRDDRALRGLLDRIGDASRLALDTEFLRERTYYPKLCLLQLATSDTLALVDPLADVDLDPVWDLVCDGREIVLHAGGQDLEIIQRLAGRLPARLFDTQIAAGFIGLGYSVGYTKLVDAVLGAGPGPSEAYTDWSRRPLTDQQREYALDDVRYLLEVAERMQSRLEQLGRTAWAREEIDKSVEAVCHTPDPDEQWRRVKGARGLSGRSLVVLQKVTAWRERQAIRRDVPRKRVLPDRVLVSLGRRALENADAIRDMRGIHPSEAKRSAEAIATVVREALEVPQQEWPRWPERRSLPTDPSVDAAASLLDAIVRARGEEMEIASRLLATRSDLTLLVRLSLDDSVQSRTDLPLLSGWRREAVGDQLLALLRGEATVRVRPGNRTLSIELS